MVSVKLNHCLKPENMTMDQIFNDNTDLKKIENEKKKIKMSRRNDIDEPIEKAMKDCIQNLILVYSVQNVISMNHVQKY